MSTGRLEPLVAGSLHAPILNLGAPISFWGGIDNLSGRVIDRNHPQCGAETHGTCLIVPMIRGSGGTPGNLAMLIKRDRAPAGIVLGYPDINVTTGVVVAEHLYAKRCPLFLATENELTALGSHAFITIEADGSYEAR